MIVLSESEVRPSRAVEARRSTLTERAEKLWPDSQQNQIEWLRAVEVVRRSGKGWVVDRMVRKGHGT